MQRLGSRILCAAALVFLTLSSAGCSSVFGGQATPPASPPQPTKPCELPYQEKASELPPQANLNAPLPGDQLVDLLKNDDALFNALFPKFNANIDWAGAHCITKPADATPSPAK